MFTQFFFLILVVLVMNLALEIPLEAWSSSLAITALLATVGYLLICGLIIIQNWLNPHASKRRRLRLLFLSNCYLVAYFLYYHFFLSVQSFYPQYFNNEFLFSIPTLFLYFFGLFLYYRSSNATNGEAWTQVRFYIPFLIPYFLITFLLGIIPASFGEVELIAVLLFLLLVVILFFPYTLKTFWKCHPLKNVELNQRLEELCKRANFKHAGMLTWGVMKNSATAAIVGILPKLRYVMFTDKLLRILSPEQIEAVLAHEIGHSKRRHLIYYPLIVLGMLVTTSLFFQLLPGSWIESIPKRWFPLIVFIPYAVIMGLYFRFVFGYFSRLFERQADLHIYELGVAPEHMVGALDQVGTSSGNTHRNPSWHHFSIQQRIAYLKKTAVHPRLIKKHHRRVRKAMIIYMIFLILAILVSIYDFFS